MSFHSLIPPLSSTQLPNFAALKNVITPLVTHPSHVGWQLSHLPAVTRCNGDKHLTTAQSFFGHFVLEGALHKGWVGGTNQISTHTKEKGGIGGGPGNQIPASSTVKLKDT